MTAAARLFDLASPTVLTPAHLRVALPRELRALFDESAKMTASFHRLPEQECRGLVRYIEEAKTPATRERRAAIVAMSLMGLGRDLPADPAPFRG